MYGKWFASAYTGSMAGAGADVFAVWGYVVAHAGYGYVDLNPTVVAALIGMPVKNVDTSIDYLCKPDPASRNPEQDGCRLIHEYGFRYRVVSQPMYRDAFKSEEARREYLRVKQQESRARKKQALNQTIKNVDSQQLTVNNVSTDVNQAEVEVDTISDTSYPHPAHSVNGEHKPSPEQGIYDQYPRKAGYRVALKAIENAIARVRKGEGKLAAIPEKRDACVYLFRRVQAYARSPAGSRPDKDFIPHPSTWFNQSRYLDEDSVWQDVGDKKGPQQEKLQILRKPPERAVN